jgi:hypothetical protein
MSDRVLSENVLPSGPRSSRPEEADLDDLLQSYEPLPGRSRPTRKRPWLVRCALQAFAASAVVYAAFHIAELAPPYPMILAVCLGAVLVRQAVRMTAEPPTQRVADAVRAPAVRRLVDPASWYEGGDGMLEAVRRWDRRLDWGSGGSERFASTVAVRIGELADERLRLRHGITRATDPDRARALLGEELWTLLHEPPDRVPKPREIAAASDRLESL